jgi:cell division protein FtsA
LYRLGWFWQRPADPTERMHVKNRQDHSEIVVGLDIGTTKVSAVVGEVDGDGITILGVGNVPCRGLRKGVVSNIDWTVRAISEAIEAAQTMAGVEIRTVYAASVAATCAARTPTASPP